MQHKQGLLLLLMLLTSSSASSGFVPTCGSSSLGGCAGAICSFQQRMFG
jgi:hypothetical protein